MGSSQSKEQRKMTQNRSLIGKDATSSLTTTPDLSRSSSSSASHSRATSMIVDVKDCMHKMLGRPLDIPTSRMTPRRSSSAPADLFSRQEKINEQDRFTNTHFVLKHCFGDNVAAPVHDLLSKSISLTRKSSFKSIVSTSSCNKAVTRVLDIACGSGVWILEMATNYPNSEFYGIDIAPVFPHAIKPPNAYFQQWDMLDPEGFPFIDEYFDYVHMRLVYDCFSTTDLKFVLKEISRVLKPGGYIEIRDIDPIIKNPGPVTERIFSDFAVCMYKQHAIDVTWTTCIGETLKNEAHMTDVHHQEVFIRYDDSLSSLKCSFLDTLSSYKEYLKRTFDMDSFELDEKLDIIQQECALYQSYFSYYLGWGRKPLTTEKLVKESASPTAIEIETLENAYDIVHLTQGFTE